MFRQKEWPFTGASGTKYLFSIRPKSAGPPGGPGVFILAYTHPRGHLAGWRVTPLLIGHAEDMRAPIVNEVELHKDQAPLWNSTFVLPEPSASARETCVRDLKSLEPFHI